MSGEEKKINLYVLRYKYSGHYYVGTAEDFGKRMLVHWRRTSTKRKLPIWSKMNKSTKGFRFYWFNVNKNGVSQSEADHWENQLAKKIVEKIYDINKKNFIKEVHVGNGNRIDRKYRYDIKTVISDIKNEFNEIDEIIADFLINTEKLGFRKDEVQIECCNIGYFEEYNSSQHDKSWREVVH